MRIANFNVQNMRLRCTDTGETLDGAVDRDMATPPDPALDVLDRRLTAEVLRNIDADIVALQEVFDTATLDFFHDTFLVPGGARPYQHRYCFPGNDGQGMNVALMSRLPPLSVASHADATVEDFGIRDAPAKLRTGRLFRRDCLEATFASVTLFICHFKAPYPDPDEARGVRHTEAQAVRRLIEHRFPDPAMAQWLVIGDLNEPETESPSSSLSPLSEPFSVDLMARLREGENWTFTEPATGDHTRPDALLASPALAAAFPLARPGIVRARTTGPRPHASDHAAVFIDFSENDLRAK